MLDKVTEGLFVLDVGTSYGQWHDYLRAKGFAQVYGVEIDEGRARLARTRGYELVFHTDGAEVPLPDQSLDVAISNGVFVHILRLEDKIAVIKEMQRLLKPGGTFIFNQTMSKAYGYEGYKVSTYMSYMGLDEVIELISEHSTFRVKDIAPTYYSFRKSSAGLFTWVVRKAMRLPIPFLVEILTWLTTLHSRKYRLEESDAVYFKLVKPVEN